MRPSARDIAVIAVTVALLIGGQALFAALPGVEVVTVVLLSFSWSFGAARGMLTATAYSLLRCFFFGFDAKTVVLYLLYFNFFACLFGVLGGRGGGKAGAAGEKAEKEGKGEKEKISPLSAVFTEGLFLALCVLAAAVLSGAVRVSVLLQTGLNILAWVLLFIASAGAVAYNILLFFSRKYPACAAAAQTVAAAAAAAVCTVLFTLLDDALYPLFYGVRGEAAVAYFYASFTAMLPQTVCALVSVSILFRPLTRVFRRFATPRSGR